MSARPEAGSRPTGPASAARRGSARTIRGALYYKDNHPRLQRVEARWDPRDVFRHALSILLP